jgi:phage tail P2-like protein
VSIADGSLCIDTTDSGVSQYQLLINHPGEVHQDMFRKTPPFYFDNGNFKLADDPQLEFYRPYADILQDIFEEQTFLNGINHLDKIPAQLIPYLAYLIGWDLPNFPGASDAVRRAVLRQAVHLQKLKGSRRALIELFEIFGFTIDLINLWYTSDGKRLVAPGEDLPAELEEDEILVQTVHQVDPLLADYAESGFGDLTIPLLYRATTDIKVYAYLLDPSNGDYAALSEIAENLTNEPGTSLANQLASIAPTSSTQFTEVTLDMRTGLAKSIISTVPVPPIGTKTLKYDPIKNVILMNFDHYLDFSDGSKLFVFALYDRTKLVIPPQLDNLRSNRFDVRIFLKSGQRPAPLLLEFLLNFVFKLKAFHSLLRKIVFNIDFVEVYGVQDFCLGNTIGPPGIPGGTDITAGVCSDLEGSLTEEEKEIRELIYQGLLEEFKAWRSLDGTHADDSSLDHLLRLPVQLPEGVSCQFTQFGQDRVSTEPFTDFDQNPDLRQKVCPDLVPLPPHCFKGRVQADLIMGLSTRLTEIYRFKPCSLGIGGGYYWMYPQNALSLLRNGFGQFRGQSNRGFLGTMISQYGKPLPRSLHYTNRAGLIDKQLDSDQLLAYRRPSLEIEKDNLWFPSHRFVRMSHIKDDFTHPEWVAKPWYFEDNELNAYLTTDTNGDQVIVYDAKPLIYEGNGRDVDVSSLGTHEDRSFLVTHKVYLKNKNQHPAISLDPRIVLTDDDSITFDSATEFPPIFRSYNANCNKDYSSGYPAVTGRFTVDMSQYDFGTGSEGQSLAELLGLPVRSGTDVVSALFTLGSGILIDETHPEYQYYIPYRLDCECNRFNCDATGETGATSTGLSEAQEELLNIDPCILNQFRNNKGEYEFTPDQLTISQKIVLPENVGVCSTRLDGTIPNMMCILDGSEIPANSKILPVGSFYWKDTYGNIYDGAWTFNGVVLDLHYVVKQPFVWGEPKTGFVYNNRVYVKGVITTYHQIYLISPAGKKLAGNIISQRIDYFQTNVVCNDKQFVDNFCFHVDCAVLDDILNLVSCGTRWSEFDDVQVQWPDLVVDSSGVVTGYTTPAGIQPFIFMDVWGNSEAADLPVVCPAGSGSGS